MCSGVRELARDPGRLYLTLDDLDVLEQAESAPGDLVGRSERITIDEVQRAPQLLHSVKRAVDKKRTRGQLLLTGSANMLLMRRIAESLAGRAAYLTLWPLTRREQLGLGSAGVWSDLLGARAQDWLDIRSDRNTDDAVRGRSCFTPVSGPSRWPLEF
jgi:predicted AAA+ superfamily ATPase